MTKLQDTQQSIEDLKTLSEFLYSMPESRLVEEYEKFEEFRDKLNSLLSTIARYRIQLDSSEEKIIFGPKTLKTVQTIVSDYDKLYEIYEDHLYNIYSPIEHLYNEMIARNKNSEETDQATANVKSIHDETKSHLKQIDELKKKLEENRSCLDQVDFQNIQNNEVVLNDLFNQILRIFKEDPCNDLEKILFDIYEAHEENFVEILVNVSNLLREIARKPDEVNLRILRINNEKLQKDFLGFSNSVKLLKFTGFRIATTDEIQQHLSTLNLKFGDEYFLYLHEPDMFTLYSKWKDWLNNINNISTTLTSFLSNYKTLRRTENDIKTVISKSLD